MNHYELLAIVTGRYAENEAEQVFQKIEDSIKKHTPVIHYRQNLDRKRLAYEINHQSHGYYFLVEFDGEPQSIHALSTALTLNKDIVRFQIIKRKTVGKPKTAERKQSLEQEAFGKRAAKALGDIDILAIAPETPVAPTPIATAQDSSAPAVVPTAPQESEETEETKEERVSEKKKKKEDVVKKEPVAETVETAAEKEPAPASSRKKQEKLDYTDLNKKLDDILNNDII